MANGKKQKMTAKQLKEREERALERQRLAEEKKKREELLKRIFVIGSLSSHHGPYVPWRKPIKAPSGKTTKRCPPLCGLVALKR